MQSKDSGLFRNVHWEHLVAGVGGGVVSTLVLHPLDLIKIRFQVSEGSSATANLRPQYNGIIDAVRKIFRDAGFRGLYQGVTPNVWGAGASWGLYFLFYNSLKAWRQECTNKSELSAAEHMLAAAESGVLTLALTNPIWVAKTRICLQYDQFAATKASSQYSGVIDCLRQTFKAEGIRGLYKGFLPGILGVSHGALQFMAYEDLKRRYNRHKNRPNTAKFSSFEYITFAAISKIFAASITYPYQVVRSRLQDQHRNYSGVLDVVRQTWRLEGSRGLFRGFSPYMLHVTPNVCIVFLAYELFLQWTFVR